MVRSQTRMVEPEWTDRHRDLVEGLALHDHDLCPGCGLHPWVLAHPELVHLTLQDTYCDMCKLQATYGRRVAARDDDWAKEHKDAKPGLPRPNDGLHVRLKNLSPAEVAERKLRAAKAGTHG